MKLDLYRSKFMRKIELTSVLRIKYLFVFSIGKIYFSNNLKIHRWLQIVSDNPRFHLVLIPVILYKFPH